MVASEMLFVRRAGAADVETMTELAQAAYEMYVERIGRRPAPMTADYADVVESGLAWVAQRGVRIVGLLVLELAEDHLLIDNVAVLPQVRGFGVGSLLMRLAEAQARERGFREIRLFTNEAMVENLVYYSRRGFLETHRVTQNGYRRVFLAKTLD